MKAVPAFPWFRETLASSWAAQGRVLQLQGKASDALQSFEEAIVNIQNASDSAPEAAVLRKDLTVLVQERGKLRDAGMNGLTRP